MNNLEHVLVGLERCNGNCRKCGWRNRFDGSCELHPTVIAYVKTLERDNAKKIVYCKDCMFCEKEEARFALDNDRYECKHKDGLRKIYVLPVDHCSVGVPRRAKLEDTSGE